MSIRVASKYGTSVMTEEEVLMFVESALVNGSEVKEALADMRMIDTLLYADLLQKTVGRLNQKTTNGFYRKGSDFYSMMNSIIEGRMSGALS